METQRHGDFYEWVYQCSQWYGARKLSFFNALRICRRMDQSFDGDSHRPMYAYGRQCTHPDRFFAALRMTGLLFFA